MKMHGRKPVNIAVCIGCGCDDLHACEDGLGDPCAWFVVDRRLGIGICTGHSVTDQMRLAYKAMRRHLQRFMR